MPKKIRAKNRKPKEVKQRKTDKLGRIISILNVILLILLALLVVYETIEIKSVLSSRQTQKIPEAEDIIVTESTPEDIDEDYLYQALEFDEMESSTEPVSSSIIISNSEVSHEILSGEWEEKIAHINKIDIPAEAVYGLYEENLPNDVIQSDSNLGHIKINVARKPPYFGNTPVIAIVIDDMGISHKRTKDISTLKYPLTASFLTYATELKKQIDASFASGQEIMAHLPMEPKIIANVSPDVLTTKMTDKEIKDGLKQMLSKFDNIKGVNNHMGSRFTEDEHRMNIVMEELSGHNLFFLDSKTTPKSAVDKSAKKHGIAYVARNVFLDNEDKFDYIMKQLKQTEDIAKKEGYAVAIGHPKSQTYKALKAWLPTLKEKNIKLVHLSEIVSVLSNHQ